MNDRYQAPAAMDVAEESDSAIVCLLGEPDAYALLVDRYAPAVRSSTSDSAVVDFGFLHCGKSTTTPPTTSILIPFKERSYGYFY